MEDDFENFRREFMTDIVTSLRDDLGDDIATLKMDPDTGSYNIEFNVTIRESSVSTPPPQEQGGRKIPGHHDGAYPTNSPKLSSRTQPTKTSTNLSPQKPSIIKMSAKTSKHNNTSRSRDSYKDLARRIEKNQLMIIQMMQSMQQSMKAMNDVTTAVMMPLPNKVESVTAVELSVETIAEDEATLEQESTIAQKVPFLHADSNSAMGRPFLVPPDSYPTKSQTHYPPTSNTCTMKWIPNLDGWMMLHDLKKWIKIHFLMGWLKCITLFSKFMLHSVIGSMKLHDLKGWLKESLICIFLF
eukprot:scaffold43964_cov66-Cyclotella_meneghiniana.AAC.1